MTGTCMLIQVPPYQIQVIRIAWQF
jgi:hypothetical protein